MDYTSSVTDDFHWGTELWQDTEWKGVFVWCVCVVCNGVFVCYLDQVEDDDGRPKALQHLVKVEGGDKGVRVRLVHWEQGHTHQTGRLPSPGGSLVVSNFP